jgi:hypothetical protein
VTGRLIHAIGGRRGWDANGDIGAFVPSGGWWARVRPVGRSDLPGGAWRVVVMSPRGREASRVRVNTAVVAVRVAEDMVRRASSRAARRPQSSRPS